MFNEGFVILLTSKLILSFQWRFHFDNETQSLAHLLNESEHIYWILDLEDEALNIGFVD